MYADMSTLCPNALFADMGVRKQDMGARKQDMGMGNK